MNFCFWIRSALIMMSTHNVAVTTATLFVHSFQGVSFGCFTPIEIFLLVVKCTCTLEKSEKGVAGGAPEQITEDLSGLHV